LRSFALGYGLSAIGQSMSTVAVLIVVHERTGSLVWVALVGATRLLPYMLVSPFAGLVADHLPRQHVLRAGHLARATLALGLVAVTVVGAPVLLVVSLAFALTTCGTLCFPAAIAGLPHLVSPEQLPRANAMVSGIETVAFLVGPALGGLLVAVTTPACTFLVDAAVLAGAAAFVPGPLGGGRVDDIAAVDHAGPEWQWGARRVVASPAVRSALLAAALVNVVGGAVSVLVLPMATDQLGRAAAGAGLLAAAFGAGGVVGAAVAAWRTSWSPALVVLLTGVPIALTAPSPHVIVVAGLLAVAGAASTLIEVLMITRIHEATPDPMMARVFGLFDAVVIGAVALGAALTPACLALFGLAGTLVAIGLVIPVPALVALRPRMGRSVPSPA
jgi:predicted MFS family arabinose efflux permease